MKPITDSNSIIVNMNYRTNGFGIWNKNTGKYDSLVGGVLSANMANFFENYVDENGKSYICLFVVKQYIVDLSTSGFTQDGFTFSNNDLGSYTIQFIGGEYTDLGSGKYMVDYGTEIKLTNTVGKYGDFSGFAGLSEEESEALSFTVDGNRYISINLASSKLAAWIMPTIFGGSGLVILLALMSLYLVMRAKKLKKEKLARETEIRDMKRKFNISSEIEALREGKDVPQSNPAAAKK